MDEESDTLRCEVKIDQRPIRLVKTLLECWYHLLSKHCLEYETMA